MGFRQPANRVVGDGLYQLTEPAGYTWDGYRITAPKDFVYDGASIPPWAWSVLRLHPDGIMRGPSSIHDWLYLHQGKLPHRVFTRKEADEVLRALMVEVGIGWIRRSLVYGFVRSFGWVAWRKHG